MGCRWDFARECCLCRKDASFLGKLLGPIGEDRTTGGALFVHRLCAIWSPEVYQTDEGTIKNISASLKRGRTILCAHCGKRGATIGCVLERCQCSFHLSCAKEAGCHFLPMKYLLSCADHSAMLVDAAMKVTGVDKREGLGPQTTQPYIVPAWGSAEAGAQATESQALPDTSPLQGASMQPEQAHNSGDIMTPLGIGEELHASTDLKRSPPWRQKGVKARCKRARNTLKAFKISQRLGSERHHHGYDSDEEKFKQQERVRYDRDRQAIQGAVACQTESQGFECVGGLQSVVRQLKEMVLLPLAYPDLFGAMGVDPPRGVLLHGEPGCGKTLLARALAGACSKQGDCPVTFFSRKGADCLGEFAGDAERILRILFEEAQSKAPSVIFLDELDALVPCRSAREGGSDQTYASVVTTVLALMDGVSDRGHVVIIGATNRPDAIDPALRRPGRFDREVYVGLPNAADRAEILAALTRQWNLQPAKGLLTAVADAAEGFGGADLAALCTGAVLAALKRAAPELSDSGDLSQRMESGAEKADIVAGPPVSQGTEGGSALLKSRLDEVKVTSCDWTVALADSAPPCSTRQGLATLTADLCQSLDYHVSPIVFPALLDTIDSLRRSGMNLTGALHEACQAAEETQEAPLRGRWPHMDGILTSLCAVQPCTHPLLVLPRLDLLPAVDGAGSDQSPGVANLKSRQSEVPTRQFRSRIPNMQLRNNGSSASCRILLCGAGDQGQQACCGAILRLASPNFAVVALPQILDASAGSASTGVVSLLSEALRKSSGTPAPLILYLPRFEDWAVFDGPTGEEPSPTGSGPWKTFESAVSDHAASKQIVILASCQRPLSWIPQPVVHFFTRGRPVSSRGGPGVVICAANRRHCPTGMVDIFLKRLVVKAAAAAAGEVAAVVYKSLQTLSARESAECPEAKETTPTTAKPGERVNPTDTPAFKMNTAVLEGGRRTYFQLQASLVAFGQRLLRDKRSKMAAGLSHSSSERQRESKPPKSFFDIGKLLAQGRIRTIQELSQTVQQLTAVIQKTESSSAVYASSAAAASALEDHVFLWIDGITRQLKLNDSEVQTASIAAHKEYLKSQQDRISAATSRQQEINSSSQGVSDPSLPFNDKGIASPAGLLSSLDRKAPFAASSVDTKVDGAGSQLPYGATATPTAVNQWPSSNQEVGAVDRQGVENQHAAAATLPARPSPDATRVEAPGGAPTDVKPRTHQWTLQLAEHLQAGITAFAESVVCGSLLAAADDFLAIATACARQHAESEMHLPLPEGGLPDLETTTQAIAGRMQAAYANSM